MYRPIADYALIGNTRCAALVSSDASIDWCCLPRFDGPAVLGVLYCYKGEVQKGRKVFRKSMRMNPFEIRNYFNFGLSLLGASGFKKLKKAKEKLHGSIAYPR